MRHEVTHVQKNSNKIWFFARFFRNFMSLRVMKLGYIRENSKYLF